MQRLRVHLNSLLHNKRMKLWRYRPYVYHMPSNYKLIWIQWFCERPIYTRAISLVLSLNIIIVHKNPPTGIDIMWIIYANFLRISSNQMSVTCYGLHGSCGSYSISLVSLALRGKCAVSVVPIIDLLASWSLMLRADFVTALYYGRAFR